MGQPLLVLLPGMDGTGELFAPLRRVMPADASGRVVSYPPDETLSYDELLARVRRELAREREVVLVAESFSGPLALRYAVAEPGRVRAVVVCASFVRPPAPVWLRHFAWPLLLRLPPPDWAVRRFLVGADAPGDLVAAVKAAVGKVRPRVLAGRLREVLAVDCCETLRRCEVPVLWLTPTADALVRTIDFDSIRALNPRLTVARLDGPHLLLQARPAAAWGAVAEFLSRDVKAPVF